jgi:ribonuclease E
VPRGHGQRGRDVGRPPREERPRSAPARRRFEDDIEIDAELDSGLRELWESHESEAPSSARAETVDIDDLEIEDEIEEAAPAPRGERPRDEEHGRGRRRRRRRGRRGSRDSAAPSEGVEPARSRAAEDEALELDDLDLEDIGEEPVAEAPSRREPERAARPSRGGMHEEEQRTPGKRRRRRRRPTSERTDRAEDLDELDDEGLEGPASVDYLSESDRAEGHKRIPTWDDAVGAIVAANLELRSRNPQPPRREGRGRR